MRNHDRKDIGKVNSNDSPTDLKPVIEKGVWIMTHTPLKNILSLTKILEEGTSRKKLPKIKSRVNITQRRTDVLCEIENV